MLFLASVIASNKGLSVGDSGGIVVDDRLLVAFSK